MADSISEKIVQSLHRINKELLDISEKTFFAGPLIKNIPSSTKASWLGEEEMISAFRQSFKTLGVEEKQDTSECSKTRVANVTRTEKLTEQKELMEKEIEKVLKQQTEVETNILNAVKQMDNISVLNSNVNSEDGRILFS